MPRDARTPQSRIPYALRSGTQYVQGHHAARSETDTWTWKRVETLLRLRLGTARGDEWEWGVIDGLADTLISRGGTLDIEKKLGWRR